MIAIKAVDVILGFVNDKIDSKYFDGILRMSEQQRRESTLITRLASEKHIADGEEQVVGKKSRLRDEVKGWTWAGLGVGAIMVVVAWVVYLVFSQGTNQSS